MKYAHTLAFIQELASVNGLPLREITTESFADVENIDEIEAAATRAIDSIEQIVDGEEDDMFETCIEYNASCLHFFLNECFEGEHYDKFFLPVGGIL